MPGATDSLDEYARSLSRLALPFSKVENALTRRYFIQWDMARFDLLDTQLSGNKLFKLLPYLLQAKAEGISCLLSFGGVYSNHLHALSLAGQRFGFSVIAIVRGYEQQPETPTLKEIRQTGAEVHLVGNSAYARRYDIDYIQSLQDKYPHALIIPEGGFAMPGIQGAQMMAKALLPALDGNEPAIIAMATGTGTTLLGFLGAGIFSARHSVYGYSALQNAEKLSAVIAGKIAENHWHVPQWRVSDDYCCGGFARMNAGLAMFMRDFEIEQHIPLDPVYTGKLCFAVAQDIGKGMIAEGSRIITVHTGGLQGRRGMQARMDAYCQSDNRELQPDYV